MSGKLWNYSLRSGEFLKLRLENRRNRFWGHKEAHTIIQIQRLCRKRFIGKVVFSYTQTFFFPFFFSFLFSFFSFLLSHFFFSFFTFFSLNFWNPPHLLHRAARLPRSIATQLPWIGTSEVHMLLTPSCGIKNMLEALMVDHLHNYALLGRAGGA